MSEVRKNGKLGLVIWTTMEMMPLTLLTKDFLMSLNSRLMLKMFAEKKNGRLGLKRMLMVLTTKQEKPTVDFHILPRFNLRDGLDLRILQLREVRSSGSITLVPTLTTRTGHQTQMISEDHTFTPPSRPVRLMSKEKKNGKTGLKSIMTGLMVKLLRLIQDCHTLAL